LEDTAAASSKAFAAMLGLHLPSGLRKRSGCNTHYESFAIRCNVASTGLDYSLQSLSKVFMNSSLRSSVLCFLIKKKGDEKENKIKSSFKFIYQPDGCRKEYYNDERNMYLLFSFALNMHESI
jgi:hypothetical protein